MAQITDYTTLQTEIANWLNRGDAQLLDSIPTFIQLAEATIRRTLRTKHKGTQTIPTVADTGEYTLASDIIENYVAYITDPVDKAGELDSVGRGKLWDNRRIVGGVAGRPNLISIVGTSVVLSPVPDDIYNVEILQEGPFTSLSGGNPTNYILDSYQDVYLYGALVHSAPWLKEDPRIATWQGFLSKALRELEIAQERNEYPHTPIAKIPVNLAPMSSIRGR